MVYIYRYYVSDRFIRGFRSFVCGDEILGGSDDTYDNPTIVMVIIDVRSMLKDTETMNFV